MCASSVVLWATAAAFQSYKARLRKRELERGVHLLHVLPLYERVILGGSLYLLKFYWPRVRWKWDKLREACGWSSGV